MNAYFMNKILVISILVSSSLFAIAQNSAYNRESLMQMFQNQDYEGASAYLKGIQPQGNYLQYYLDLGYSYYMQNLFTEANATYQQAYNLDTNNIQANLYLADIYSRQRVNELAYGHYKRLIRIDPSAYRYWQSAATSLERMKEYDSAYNYIEKSYALRPQSPSVTYQYAEAMQRKKMLDEAEKIVDSYLSVDSLNDMIVSKKIDISFKKSKNNEVIFWGERLWNANSQAAGALTTLAFSYLNTGRLDKCLELYSWMDEQNMKNESLTYCAALAHARKKNFAKSNELLEECIDNNILKEAVIYLRAKADNYEAVKDYNRAVAYYDTSYYLFQMPADLYHAGSIYDRGLKNKARASAYYKRYLQRKGAPQNNTDKQIADYIKEYLKPKEK